ncbi:ribonuclease E/G [Paracoccus pacificus]|uniref:Ribonuclease E/G n=1 Tax=Paracoccus pacificus TaxID=1463598 RepID=A0ABW4R9Q1_9RHOB
MKGRQVILGRLNGAEAAALTVDGRLEDLVLDASALAGLPPGAICRGVVDRLVKGQGGVFLRLPDGLRGYLRDRSGLSEGQTITVQVAGVAEPGKAVPVTSRILFRGRHSIVTPDAPGINVSRRLQDPGLRADLIGIGEDALNGWRATETAPGIIMRSAAAEADPGDIRAELVAQLELAAAVLGDQAKGAELLVDAPSPWESAWRDWADPAPGAIEQSDDAFDIHGVSDAIAELTDPRVALPGGGAMYIEPTRALVAIDVNTGADTSPAAALKANIAAARDLPRQLRLRGLGGQVVVDFAPMPKRDRGTLEQQLRTAFRNEGAETVLTGWTGLGLYELTRKRDRMPLARLLGGA